MKINFLRLMVGLFVVFLIIFAAASFYFIEEKGFVDGEMKVAPVCFGEKCFNVEIASSFSTRMRGLMERNNLQDGAGMLFVFPTEGEYAFWMKKTLIPLDIIWLNKDKEIVYLAENVQPCKSLICPSVSPGKPALYVLEINAGKAADADLKVGDRAKFDLR